MVNTHPREEMTNACRALTVVTLALLLLAAPFFTVTLQIWTRLVNPTPWPAVNFAAVAGSPFWLMGLFYLIKRGRRLKPKQSTPLKEPNPSPGWEVGTNRGCREIAGANSEPEYLIQKVVPFHF